MNRDVTLVFGQTGMGKSLFTKRVTASFPRLLVCDPQGEYVSTLQCDDVGVLIARLQQMPRAFRLSTPDVEQFPLLCETAMTVGRCWLVIDEAQRVVPPFAQLSAEFQDVVYRGRHPEVSFLLVAQRPTTVHLTARSQWNRIVTFRQTEKADTNWIRNVSGFDVEPRDLSRFEYFDITPQGFVLRKLDPPKGFVPSSSRQSLHDATETRERRA